MSDYELQLERAWSSTLQELRKGNNLVTSVGKIRGSYGEAIANTVQDKIVKILLTSEDSNE